MRLAPDQVAVVTGGAGGIGRGIVDALARRGLTVAIADIEADAVDRAVADVVAAGGRAVPGVVDVTDGPAVRRLADRLLAEHGRVDVLVNNAGVIPERRPLWEHTPADWRWVTDVNLLGVAHGISAFVPAMVAAGRGHVVNTSSMAGLTPIEGGGQGAYSATKHGVVGLSETLRVELDLHAPAVGVTVLCPGPVPSRIHDSVRNRPDALTDAGAAPADAPTPAPSAMTTLEPVAADVVGGQVCDAIESDRMYLLTDAAIAPLARARAQRLLDQL